jgi:hypothetical protein
MMVLKVVLEEVQVFLLVVLGVVVVEVDLQASLDLHYTDYRPHRPHPHPRPPPDCGMELEEAEVWASREPTRTELSGLKVRDPMKVALNN